MNYVKIVLVTYVSILTDIIGVLRIDEVYFKYIV